jgi:chromosome segregation ATPase
MNMITNEINSMNKNRDDNSNRFTDAMTRVTDLLKVNQMLRDESNSKDDTIRKKNVEIFETTEENEELRDKIELLETIVQSDRDSFSKYVNSQLISEAEKTQMGEYIGIDEG